jgi:hypothetical protein
MTKDERIAMLRSRGQSSMANPNKTGDCEGVLQSLNIPDFFKTTIGSMAPEKKAELVTACDSLDKSELNKILEKVGSILVPRLREWKEARCNIETSIAAAENGLEMKFVEEFMSGSQMNWNKFYSLFYLEQADEDEDMDL